MASVTPDPNSTDAKLDDPAVPQVDPQSVVVDGEGYHSRNIVCWAGEGMTADDLRSAKIWKRVQGNKQRQLRVYDRLTVYAADESWIAQCIVTEADASSAQLHISKVGSFREIGAGLWSDGDLEIAFENGSYIVRRCRDKVRVCGARGFATESAAVRAAQQTYETGTAR
jgi:hypothetical protein